MDEILKKLEHLLEDRTITRLSLAIDLESSISTPTAFLITDELTRVDSSIARLKEQIAKRKTHVG